MNAATPQAPPYETDPSPSEEVVERYLRARAVNDESASLATVHHRATRHEFDLGIRYARSSDAREREVGAKILGELGWGRQSFHTESVDALLVLLSDPDEDVICAAAGALEYRRSERAIPRLVELAGHGNPSIRSAVTYGLTLEDDRAIAALIQLSGDTDRDVRNWATFSLGSQLGTDSPAIRAALRERLTDSDNEVRGEALVGLAVRHDPSIAEALRAEWSGDDISLLSIEAAGESAHPGLLPELLAFRETLDVSSNPHFAEVLAAAISACTPGGEPCAQGRPGGPRRDR